MMCCLSDKILQKQESSSDAWKFGIELQSKEEKKKKKIKQFSN